MKDRAGYNKLRFGKQTQNTNLKHTHDFMDYDEFNFYSSNSFMTIDLIASVYSIHVLLNKSHGSFSLKVLETVRKSIFLL